MNGIQAIRTSNISNVNFKGTVDDVTNTDLLSQDAEPDSFELQHKNANYELTKADKQEIVRSARQTAAGWSIFGGPISTLYFGLRSNKTVAKKYNLDVDADKALIKQIKNQQILWTIPGAIYGVGLLPSLVAWLYNKNMDASRIDVV